MRILIRTSKLAVWSRRFASFALPFGVLPIWMHRNQLLNSQTFQLLLLLAIVLASLAVLTGIAAYIRLWQSGDQGWRKATLGIFIGLLCLSPIAYGATLAMQYPLANDISTDMGRPLPLLAKVQTATRSQLSVAQVQTAFPGVTTRQYVLDSTIVFEQVEDLVRQRKWDIRVRRKPGAQGARGAISGAIGSSINGTINAMAMTLLGWRDEVAIRILPTATGARVDMRSASLNGAHDLGTNGKRIEQFLADLDAAILLAQKTGTQDHEIASEETGADADGPASTPH